METTKQMAPKYNPTASKHDATAWKHSRNGLIPAVVIGTTLEWYDVMIYAQAAAIIFPALFFPEVGPAIGTIAAFATYGVGYLARPLGAVIFGHIGDRYGRKVALVSTLLLMGGATTLIGALPTFASVGFFAPLMLMVLRLLQGLGAGAEYAGAFVMIGEMAPTKRRGYWSSIPGIGIYAGVVLSALVATTVFSGSEEWVANFGWRIPFLVSILLVIVGLFFRMRISESPVYAKLEQERTVRSLPFAEVFRKTPKRLFLAVLLTAPIGWNSYVSLTYSISYARQIGYDSSTAILGTLVASVLAIILVPITGWLTDNVGRRPIYIGICVVGMVTAYPFFMLLQSGSIIALYCAHILMVFGVYIITGAQAAYLTELFPAEFRYTGVALSREISTALLAAPAPAAAAALYLWSGGPWWTAGIMVLCSAACLIAVWVLPETKAINMNYTAEDLAQAKA